MQCANSLFCSDVNETCVNVELRSKNITTARFFFDFDSIQRGVRGWGDGVMEEGGGRGEDPEAVKKNHKRVLPPRDIMCHCVTVPSDGHMQWHSTKDIHHSSIAMGVTTDSTKSNAAQQGASNARMQRGPQETHARQMTSI